MYVYYSLVGLIIFVLDIYAIGSVMAGRSSVERKCLWTFAILILPVLGMALYFLIGRDRQDAVLS